MAKLNLERSVIEVGVRVQLPDWEAQEYTTVTAVGQRRFLGVPSWAESGREHIHDLSDRWVRVPDPLPTVPATNDVWVVRDVHVVGTVARCFRSRGDAKQYAHTMAEQGRLVDVWYFPVDGPPERFEATS